MQLYNAKQQLLDLPPAFRRGNRPFDQLITALAAALTLTLQSTASLITQTNFINAVAGWIDVWGDLAGIQRRPNESDAVFQPRIPNMLLAARDSAVAIQTWLELVENIAGVVTENLPSIGYSVSVPASTLPQRLQQIVRNLAYVRPAGVPVAFFTFSGGTYLDTVDYLGGPSSQPWQGGHATGSYLATRTRASGIAPPASTNNQPTSLPDLLLGDPTVNPA